jgi:hypothetical protein
MGGRWIFMECGNWQSTGRPARAILHVAMAYVADQQGQPQQQQQREQPPQQQQQQQGRVARPVRPDLADEFDREVSANAPAPRRQKQLKAMHGKCFELLPQATAKAELPAGAMPLLQLGVFEMDDNGWPTGECEGAARQPMLLA